MFPLFPQNTNSINGQNLHSVNYTRNVGSLLSFSGLYCKKISLKVVSTTFLLVCFVCLKESTCETKKNAFYFTSKALLVLEIIKI